MSIKAKTPTIRIQQTDGFVRVKLMAFHPNPGAGKNRGFAIVPNDGSLHTNDTSIRADESGQYLYINEKALTLSTRISLRRKAREKNDKPLIYDERAITVRFVWQ